MQSLWVITQKIRNAFKTLRVMICARRTLRVIMSFVRLCRPQTPLDQSKGALYSVHCITLFSIIAQVIIEKRAYRLVENCVISCYNHQARGDYNTEALIFKMATARFLIFLEKRKKKMHLL